MKLIGVEAQKKGKLAEHRVTQLVGELGLNSYYSQQLDYGGHTDLVIENVRFQISATGKSNKTIKRSQGIHQIIAGEHISRDSIIQQIYLGINWDSRES